MADNVDIQIRTTANTDGAKQTVQQLEEVRKQTKRNTDEQKRNNEEVKKATGQARNWKSALQGLAVEFPILGRVASVAMNPIAAAAAAAAGVFALVHKRVEEFNEALKETPWAGYAIGASKAADEVKRIRDLAKEAADQSQRLTDVFRARQSAEERLDEARRRLEVAQAEGMSDPAAKAARLFEIEEFYAGRAFQREERGRAFRISEQQRRAIGLRADGLGIERQLKGKQAEAALLGSPESIAAAIAKLEENLAKDVAAMLAAEEKLEKVRRESAAWEMAPRGFGPKGENPYAGELSALSYAVQMGQANTADARGLLGRYRQRLARAQALPQEITGLSTQLEGVRSSAAGIEGMLPTQMAVAGIESGAARGAFGMQGQARLIGLGNELAGQRSQVQEAMAKMVMQSGRADEALVRRIEELTRWKAAVEARMAAAENREAYSRGR